VGHRRLERAAGQLRAQQRGRGCERLGGVDRAAPGTLDVSTNGTDYDTVLSIWNGCGQYTAAGGFDADSILAAMMTAARARSRKS
jgi:hypothetical protein